MKGIVLAGGRGSRLFPVTMGMSKHLVPVHDKPLIYYPLSVLMLAGIREILLITTPEDLPNFKRLFGDGKQLGLELTYATQNTPRGVADALIISEEFIGASSVCLILGDNIFYGQGFTPTLLEQAKRTHGACVFAYPVHDPSRFGIIELNDRNQPVSIQEKPQNPMSNFAACGLYFYDSHATSIAHDLQPSDRGELEITGVNQAYLDRGQLEAIVLGRGFAWLDCGTHESLMDAGVYVHAIEERQGFKIACLEEIAFRNGWIDKYQVKRQADLIGNTSYGLYLRHLLKDGPPHLIP